MKGNSFWEITFWIEITLRKIQRGNIKIYFHFYVSYLTVINDVQVIYLSIE